MSLRKLVRVMDHKDRFATVMLKKWGRLMSGAVKVSPSTIAKIAQTPKALPLLPISNL